MGGLVHKSVVEPASLDEDLWTDVSKFEDHCVALKVIPSTNTVMPSEATLLGEPPMAWRIKPWFVPNANERSFTSMPNPWRQLSVPMPRPRPLCIRNTFIDVCLENGEDGQTSAER